MYLAASRGQAVMSTTRAAMTSAQIIGRASTGTEAVVAFNISSKVASALPR